MVAYDHIETFDAVYERSFFVAGIYLILSTLQTF